MLRRLGIVRDERPPAVAGVFYPADAEELSRQVDDFVAAAEVPTVPALRAIVGPHAGYVYSGAIAGSAYRTVVPISGRPPVRRILLLGPSHRVAFAGIAAPSHSRFVTPLGSVRLDIAAITELVEAGLARSFDRAHSEEHGLEVHLPFVQRVLGDVTVVPLVVGEAGPDEVLAVIERLWDDETLVVVSSDLSHYEDWASAREHDRRTAERIERLEDAGIGPRDACGCRPLAGLLRAAAARGMSAHRLDLRTSGDTAGPRDRVVGYGAWAFGKAGGAVEG